jgi:superfamily II DNA helicase RecQ
MVHYVQVSTGKIKILITIEAAGMVRRAHLTGIYVILHITCQGADIPDVELVIHFGVPSSLSVWIPCASCASHSSDINAHAILLVEKSTFQWRKKQKKRGQSDDNDKSGSDIDDEESKEEEDAVDADSNKMEYGKKVKLDLRLCIGCESCQRDIADEYFNNPPVCQGGSFLYSYIYILLYSGGITAHTFAVTTAAKCL